MTGRTRGCCIVSAALMAGMVAEPLGCSESRLSFPAPSVPACGRAIPNSHLQAHLVSGTVTFPFGGGPTQSWGLIDPSIPVISNRCSATLNASIRPQGTDAGAATNVATEEGWFSLTCPDDQLQRMVILGIEPRHLSAGTHLFPATPSDPQFTPAVADYSLWPPCAASTPNQFSVDITEATGGAQPYPEMVTPDYSRSLTIRLTPVVSAAYSAAGCPDLLPVIEASFSEAAADVVRDPGAIEGCL
jgi:hypothetical protein